MYISYGLTYVHCTVLSVTIFTSNVFCVDLWKVNKKINIKIKICADDVNVLRDNIVTIKETETLTDASKAVSLEVNANKTKYTLMSLLTKDVNGIFLISLFFKVKFIMIK
jgi:hypothetical protein